MSLEQLLLGLAVGALAGVLSGALGIGGGVIMVPALVLVMGVGQQTAQGTSLLVIIPTAISGAYSHYRHGLLRERLTLAVGVVGGAGAVLGSYLALHLDRGWLQRIFAIYLLFVGVRSVLRRGSKEA
jgi:uncharacterized membrane protein YfcA